ncbi:restriction endonuclease BstXI [Bifidobacterium hapali]|uniref:Restriction endonuclease BstXI n=1 Tax=Bifidobacterium hapali TaxID=1630172 RepID=A0A261FYH4_9BIFI|nr:BstXI family restriction endonuclease [Bifidobacterium hapali]OZG64234.1 restriction endonuclease BstXI [Bifidobacterium hapali]
MSTRRLKKLPLLIDRKIYKTGQTRGASNSEIYQNRVSRNSTVLIPYSQWSACRHPYSDADEYENGSIVLIDPEWYFTKVNADQVLLQEGIVLGDNAVLLYLRRGQWSRYGAQYYGTGVLPNGKPFSAPTSRTSPIGGTVLARVHGTTADADNARVYIGYNETNLRGAGIRVYEYASSTIINDVKTQLEALYWMCPGAVETAISETMSRQEALERRQRIMQKASERNLLDLDRLANIRAINPEHVTICPLCLQPIQANEFLQREEQAEGRETWDLTITEVSLFHIEELRVGSLQHRPYNLGWGHHFCNVVVKDAGIKSTLEWMTRVLVRNHIDTRKSQSNNESSLTLFDF